jgi:hypothetical protein
MNLLQDCNNAADSEVIMLQMEGGVHFLVSSEALLPTDDTQDLLLNDWSPEGLTMSEVEEHDSSNRSSESA